MVATKSGEGDPSIPCTGFSERIAPPTKSWPSSETKPTHDLSRRHERGGRVRGREAVRRTLAGGSRRRIVADFLIGAHGASVADRLLSRDRGFYRKHFETLTVVDPSIS